VFDTLTLPSDVNAGLRPDVLLNITFWYSIPSAPVPLLVGITCALVPLKVIVVPASDVIRPYLGEAFLLMLPPRIILEVASISIIAPPTVVARISISPSMVSVDARFNVSVDAVAPLLRIFIALHIAVDVEPGLNSNTGAIPTVTVLPQMMAVSSWLGYLFPPPWQLPAHVAVVLHSPFPVQKHPVMLFLMVTLDVLLQEPLLIVQRSTALSPTFTVTSVVGDAVFVIVGVPLIMLHAPVPKIGVFAAITKGTA